METNDLTYYDQFGKVQTKESNKIERARERERPEKTEGCERDRDGVCNCTVGISG